jgi:hypothetical protein
LLIQPRSKGVVDNGNFSKQSANAQNGATGHETAGRR